MFINNSITLYSYDSFTKGYIRRFVEEVFCYDTESVNTKQGGTREVDSLGVVIPLSSLWGQMSFTKGKDMIVKGICNFTFNNSSDAAISNSMKEFKKNYHSYVVMSVSYNLFGHPNMQHVELSCK